MDIKEALKLVQAYQANMSAFYHVFGTDHRYGPEIAELVQELTSAGFTAQFTNPNEYAPAKKAEGVAKVAGALSAVQQVKAAETQAQFPKVVTSTAAAWPEPVSTSAVAVKPNPTSTTAAATLPSSWPLPVGPARSAAPNTGNRLLDDSPESNMWDFSGQRFFTEAELTKLHPATLPIYINGNKVGYSSVNGVITSTAMLKSHTNMLTDIRGDTNTRLTSKVWPEQYRGRTVKVIRYVPSQYVDYGVL